MLHLKSFYILFLAILFLGGCSRTFAPEGWLPSTDDYPTDLYGGWITLVAAPDTGTKDLYEYQGEFLAVGKEDVYVLADSVYIVRKDNINNAVLELDQKNTSSYALWGTAFLLTPVVNGLLSVITLPIGVLSGIGASATEAGRDRYEADHPDDKFWNEVSKYSRFPQGPPEGIELSRIRPK